MLAPCARTHRSGILFTAALVALASTVSAQTWNQQWSDEFNDGTGRASAANWNYETGGGGWGNHELQYYQGAGSGVLENGDTNAAQIAGGVLRMQARSQNVGGMAYTSARLNTLGLKSFGPYGKMEGRMSGPSSQGLWPAFWMLGTNIASAPWPGCGEIDIMEHVNTATTIPGTIHWEFNGHASWTGSNPTMTTFTSMHKYGITWDASKITWYLNDASTGTADILNNINGTEEFHKSYFLIMNLAVGGDWPGSPNGTTVFPANFNIDYAKWYTTGAAPTPTSTATARPRATATSTATPRATTRPRATATATTASRATATATARATATATARARATATATTSGGTPAWAPGIDYTVGNLATYGGVTYRCLQAHRSITSWEPPNVAALWTVN